MHLTRRVSLTIRDQPQILAFTNQEKNNLLLSESSWYASIQEPNEWIEVNFGNSTLFNKITIAPAFPLDRAEYVKISTIFCGLVDFTVRAIGRFYLDEAAEGTFEVGVWYCHTVRLFANVWENALALRWDFHHIVGITKTSCAKINNFHLFHTQT